MIRLSTRVSLRWLPGDAFENTDTLVLSVKDWYVDLRVDISSPAAKPCIDWAIAGQRLVESVESRTYVSNGYRHISRDHAANSNSHPTRI